MPMKIKMGWVLCRYPHGVVLNPMEYVLGEGDKLLFFKTPGEALNFYVDNGGELADINHGVQIQEEIQNVG